MTTDLGRSPSRPMVRDLTETSSPVSLAFDSSPFYDMLVTLWSLSFGSEELSSHEMGLTWFEDIRTGLSTEVQAELTLLGGPRGSVWLVILGTLSGASSAHDPDSALAWLGELDAAVLRRALISYKGGEVADPTRVEAAVAGDEAAIDELLGTDSPPGWVEHMREVLGLDDLPERLTRVLARFRSEVYGRFEDEFGPPAARDAATRRSQGMSEPASMIEAVTNGLEYRIPPGVRQVTLIPSMVLRPWSVIDLLGDRLVVCYPVSDEHLQHDPDAPPTWLVKAYKAMADDRRLRILRRLGDGEATFEELGEMLGLAKSTVHYHLGILRGAGLVRGLVAPGEASRYTLRQAMIPELDHALDEYLSTETERNPR